MKKAVRLVRRVAPCVCLPLLIVLTSCTPEKSAARSAKGKLVQEAGECASDLKAQGKLPGFSGNEHGRKIASAPWESGQVSYPEKCR